MRTFLQTAAFVAFCACLAIMATGCSSTSDPFAGMLAKKPVIIAGHVNVNYPDSRPVIVAGSAGSQVAMEAGDGATPINQMTDVEIDQGKEVDIGAVATLLNDIQRSSANAGGSQAQRQSTATETGTTGDVTAPSSNEIPISIPVNVTPGAGTTIPTP